MSGRSQDRGKPFSAVDGRRDVAHAADEKPARRGASSGLLLGLRCGARRRRFWMTRRPKSHLFSTEACSIGSRGVDCKRELAREPQENFQSGALLSTTECMNTFYPCQAQTVFRWAHAHAKIPSHWSPSVERFRIHVKGMVRSPGWLDGFAEVGRRRGPWRRRWAKGLLDAAIEGENNSLRHGTACERLCKKRNRAATQPSL
jgi:hypothetical protein